MKSVVIAGYVRSPFTPAGRGELKKVRPDELGARVVKGLLKKTGVDAGTIEVLIVGCAFPEDEQDRNVARMIDFVAGLQQSVLGASATRFCVTVPDSRHLT